MKSSAAKKFDASPKPGESPNPGGSSAAQGRALHAGVKASGSAGCDFYGSSGAQRIMGQPN